VDDDVEFCQGYFEELMLQFATEPHLAGTGGVTLGAPNPRRNLVLDFIGLTSKTPGKLMSTGVASPTFVETENTLAVDWLPGCSMSFRLESVGELRFDLNRTDLPLGEDVDFTARLAMVGRLTHNHKAKLFHNLSPVNRDIERDMYRQDVIHRWTLAEQCIGRVTKMGVVSGTVSLAAIQFLAALLRLSISNLSNGIYALIGLFQVLRLGGLSENKKRYRR
jgi:GT2 family glycosyltransferase